MKRILVNGYFGVNFGDDLFFKILFEKYPNIKFEFYSNSYLQTLNKKYRYIFRNNANVSIKKYNKLRKFFEKINYTKIIDFIQYYKYDATIFIGGSIFMETEYWKKSFEEKRNIINFFDETKKAKYIIGSNFGPIKTDEFVHLYKELFRKCDDICFRDQYSYKLFSDYDNVRVAPDIVFQLKPKNIEKVKDSIGISLIEILDRKELNQYRDIYIDKLKDIVNNGVKERKKITFFSFCEAQGDVTIINDVVNSLDEKIKKNIEIVNYDGDIEGFLERFESMENIIGARFHACILSQVFGQGLYPLIYSDKTYNVLSDIGLDKEYCYIKNIDDLDVEHLFKVINDNKITDNSIFKEAEKQFEGLDKYVRER